MLEISLGRTRRWFGRLGRSYALTADQLRKRSESTQNVYARIQHSPLYEKPYKDAPLGFFADRPIIGQDTPINGGVYLGGGAREALVVDDKQDPELDRIYRNVKVHYLDPDILNNHRYGAAGIVLWTVQRDLPPNEKKAEEISNKIVPDQKVYLGRFISERAGVCRHHALLVGYLMERLIKEGLIQGKVSVMRKDTPIGPHAWAEYEESPSSMPIIIDAANGFIGTMEEAIKAFPNIYSS